MPKASTQSSVEKQGKKLLRYAEKDPRFRSARLGKALLDAVLYNKSDLAVWLLQHGADPGAKDGKGRTALWWATTYCRSAVVREMIKCGVALPDDVLIGPVIGKEPDLVRFLIRHGANVNCVASKHSSLGHMHCKEHVLTAALLTAAEEPEAESIPIMLVRAGAEVNQVIAVTWKTSDGCSMLGRASEIGLLKTVKAMITAGANVNFKDKRGRTALFDALEQGHIRVAAELLRAGAKTNVKDKTGMTPRDAVLEKEESTEMEGICWCIEQGDKISQKEQDAAKRTWEKRRKQMLALLERNSTARR